MTEVSAERLGECAGGVTFDQNGYCPECGASEDDTCGKRDGKSFKHGLRIVQLERDLAESRALLAQKEEQIAGLRRALKTILDNVNEFGAVTDQEFMDAGYAALSRTDPNKERP